MIKKYSYFFGILLFVFIIIKTDIQAVWQNAKNVELAYLPLAILLGFIILLIKSYCWNYLKKKQGIHYNAKDSFLMYGAGAYIGNVTPGRIGEISKAFYLKKDGYSVGKSLVSVVLDRISDFIFLFVFIFFSSLFYFNFLSWQVFTTLLIVLLLFFLPVIFFKNGLIKSVLKKLFFILIPEKYQKSWKINFQDFTNDIKVYKLRDYLVVFLITSFSWFFYYIQMYILGKSANITTIPILYFSLAVTIAGLITLIPISISGIGSRDAALIFLFAPFLIPKEQVIVFSALILGIYLTSTLIGLVCWLIKPIQFSKN